jgi:hypothetical protein
LGVGPGDEVAVLVKGGRVIVLEKPARISEAVRRLPQFKYPKNHVRKERDSWD